MAIQYPGKVVQFLAGVSLTALTAGFPVIGVQAARLGAMQQPVGFNWPQGSYPITLTRAASGITTNFNPNSYATAALAGTPYFVNGSTGNDANSGLSLAQAVKSIFKATQLGNAGAVPFNVSIANIAGGYPRENGFTNGGVPVPNTQPAAYIATGGATEVWVGSVLAWPGSPDGTFPNTYLVARSLVSRVLDLANTDANGDYAELTKVADAATCNSTPNSWAQVAGNLYVHRTGEVAPTTANTRVLLQTIANFFCNATSKDVYLSGLNLQGGTAGAVAMTAAVTMNFIAVDCSAKFAGDAATNVNGFKLDFMTGLAALVRCTAACNVADGINSHWTPGGTSGMFTLTIDCIGRNNGVISTVQSCNGLTAHDGVISMDVNGQYYGNFGSNVIPINGCQMWCSGTYAHDSVGDIGHGGATPPTDIQTQNTAALWLSYVRTSGSTNSLVASNTSTILTHGIVSGSNQTQLVSAGATIGKF